MNVHTQQKFPYLKSKFTESQISEIELLIEELEEWKTKATTLGACPECRTIPPFKCKFSCSTQQRKK